MNTTTEETMIDMTLEAIEKNHRNKADAIEFIQIKIGQYRLEAEKYSGFVRSCIHQSANDLEKRLNQAMKNSSI